MIEIVNLDSIRLNEENPRIIKQDKFLELVESLKTFPGMLKARPIIIDEEGVILGGNMRYKACQLAGLNRVPVIKVKGWSEKQKKEFVIKDNINFGDWDWDLLANEWEVDDLSNWSLDLPINIEEGDYSKICNQCGLELKKKQ